MIRALQRRCVCGGTPGPDGECAECKRKRLERSAVAAGPAIAPPVVHDVLRAPGRPLEPAARGELEARLGHDFSRVRVHTDAHAAESARAVAAQAYTVGRHVVFSDGAYRPSTADGRRLLAHELTHVVQQGGGDHFGARLPVSAPDSPLEAEADASPPARTAAPSVQRKVVVNPPAAAPQIASHLNRFSATVSTSAVGELAIAGCGSVLDPGQEGNACACDAINDATRTYTINVAKSTATSEAQWLWNGWPMMVPKASVFPETSIGTNPAISFPDTGSDVEFGAFDPKGKALRAPLWRILAHELCGHGRLKQTYSGGTGDRSGHDSTIDTENAIASSKGEPARGHYADPRQGESFFNKKGDPRVVFKLKDGLHYEVP